LADKNHRLHSTNYSRLLGDRPSPFEIGQVRTRTEARLWANSLTAESMLQFRLSQNNKRRGQGTSMSRRRPQTTATPARLGTASSGLAATVGCPRARRSRAHRKKSGKTTSRSSSFPGGQPVNKTSRIQGRPALGARSCSPVGLTTAPSRLRHGLQHAPNGIPYVVVSVETQPNSRVLRLRTTRAGSRPVPDPSRSTIEGGPTGKGTGISSWSIATPKLYAAFSGQAQPGEAGRHPRGRFLI